MQVLKNTDHVKILQKPPQEAPTPSSGLLRIKRSLAASSSAFKCFHLLVDEIEIFSTN